MEGHYRDTASTLRRRGVFHRAYERLFGQKARPVDPTTPVSASAAEPSKVARSILLAGERGSSLWLRWLDRIAGVLSSFLLRAAGLPFTFKSEWPPDSAAQPPPGTTQSAAHDLAPAKLWFRLNSMDLHVVARRSELPPGWVKVFSLITPQSPPPEGGDASLRP